MAQPAPGPGSVEPGPWPGESLVEVDGVPVLRWASVPEAPTGPTLVLLPGVGHLGRIFYGPADGDPHHFLAHRLVAAGHPVVVLSYPLAHPVFPTTWPGLTLARWATVVAEATNDVVARQAPSTDVAVVAWSGAGAVAARLGRALQGRGLDLRLLVALVASPPVLGLSPRWNTYPLGHRTEEGLVGLDGLLDWFEVALADVNRRTGTEVLAADEYRRDHLGAFPVALCVSEARHRPGGFVRDPAEAAADLGANDLTGMPLVGVIRDTSPADADHALRDPWSWAPFNAAHLAALLPPGSVPSEGPAWAGLRADFDRLGSRLCRTVEGSHLCFLGAGAGPTAEAIGELLVEGRAVADEVRRAAGPPSG